MSSKSKKRIWTYGRADYDTFTHESESMLYLLWSVVSKHEDFALTNPRDALHHDKRLHFKTLPFTF